MNLDRDIFKAVKGCQEDRPQSLVYILATVDVRQTLILTYKELSGGLQRLIAGGQIAEASPGHYFDPAGQPHSTKFSGVSVEDYKKACDAYIQLFNSIKDEDDDYDFTENPIIIRWKVADNQWPTDADEDAMEEFAHQIDPILTASGQADLNGCEYGLGHIDILIFSKVTADTDAIYADIVDIFHAFGCPVGSCIIRKYKNKDDVISDIIS